MVYAETKTSILFIYNDMLFYIMQVWKISIILKKIDGSNWYYCHKINEVIQVYFVFMLID